MQAMALGDIIGLVDNTGRLVVEYGYDAWGKPTEVWSEDDPALESSLKTAYGKLAALNPFRYRGYVWDGETGLYYLRSRYDNPGWGRFINADILIGKVGKITEHNLFAYCKNEIVSYVDSNGQKRFFVTGYISTQDGDWGHVDMSILEDDGSFWTCSYGRYDQENMWGPMNAWGDGVVVIDNVRKSLNESTRKGRAIFVYELALSDEEITAIQQAVIEEVAAGTLWREEQGVRQFKLNSGNSYSTYFAGSRNCVTYTVRKLSPICADRLPRASQYIRTPKQFTGMMEFLRKENSELVLSMRGFYNGKEFILP